MGSWSGRQGRRFGWRGHAEGLDSGRLEAGEWDCLGIVDRSQKLWGWE